MRTSLTDSTDLGLARSGSLSFEDQLRRLPFRRGSALRLLPLLLFTSPVPATAIEPAPPPPAATAPATAVDSGVRHEVVAKLSEALRNNYVFPDVGEKAAEKINAALTAGE